MTFKQLQTFFWAARLGSFARASQRMNATHSTISMRIQELEAELGVKLFDRSHRTVCLTAKGNELLKYAERLIAIYTEMREHITGPESVSGLVRLGVVEVIGFTWMPNLVSELNQRYPRIDIDLEVNLTVTIVEKLRNGTLDLVLAPRHLAGPSFISESLGVVEFTWAASPSLDIPNGPLEPADLTKWPIITLTRESHHYATIENWLQTNKISFPRVYTCNSLTAVRDLTIAGLGIGFVPTVCFYQDFAQRRLRIIETKPRSSVVEYFATLPANEFQPVTRLVADLATEVSNFQRPEPVVKLKSVSKRARHGKQ